MSEQQTPPQPAKSSFARDFVRYSPRARHALALAEAEARRLNHTYLGQEHLLLALVRDGEGNAVDILAALGVDPAEVASTIEFTVGAGRQPVAGPLPRTPRLAQALDLARQEAHRLQRRVLGTEHLLLGLVEEDEGVAAVILKNFGLTADAVRERAATLDADSPREAAPAGPKSNVLTCRIDDADLETIDALVEAGLRSSRSDAAAWLIHAGIAANHALVERVYATLAEIRRLRDELQGDPARPRDE